MAMRFSYTTLFAPLFLILLLLGSCTESVETTDVPVSALPELVQKIETAHKVTDFKSQSVIAFDIELYFRGKLRLDGTLYSTTNSSKIRVDRKDGTSALFDGRTVWADSAYSGARFAILTWQYFFMAPFKLSDPGTNWEVLDNLPLFDQSLPTAKLTFGTNVGDAPDDWYIAYKNESDLLECLAYIVTYSSSVEEAEGEPHAITYHDYQTIEGIPFSTSWKFWMWEEQRGVYDQLGYANIRNIRFVEDADFEVWDTAIEMKKE